MMTDFLDSSQLSGKITKIERQKKNKHRYSIFINEKYAFGIHDDVLTDFNLLVGRIVSETEISELLNADEKTRIKIQAFRYLANRDHSEKEIADKLKIKGFSDSAIQWILIELKNLNYLNDSNFAEIFAENRLITRPVGRRQLKYELQKKGIAESVIEKTIEKVYTELDEEILAANLAAKRLTSVNEKESLKIKKRLSDFLLRRGFDWDIVKSVLEGLDS